MDKKIELCPPRECTGCEACYNACPSKAITMVGVDGFYHPLIDHALCTKCHACTRSCPILTKPVFPSLAEAKGVFAAYSRDGDNRQRSSSGGIFYELAAKVIAAKGYVYGAGFDQGWNIAHQEATTLGQAAAFRGSKYSQSRIEKTYRLIRALVIKNKPVLFSGTPCQVAGLKEYLVNDYDSLITVSLICHGVPSPLAWSEYLRDLTGDRIDSIEAISFRHKVDGKMPYRFLFKQKGAPLIIERPQDNLYMRAFISGLGLRPSCYACPFRGKLVADIFLGDFWGIEKAMPNVDATGGISALFACTEKGKNFLADIDGIEFFPSSFLAVSESNPSLAKSPIKHYATKRYIAGIGHTPYRALAARSLQPNFPRRIRNLLQKVLGRR